MIGIIGGAGPLASALLYQLILEEHYRRTRRGQQCPLPEIVLLNHVFMRGLTLDESTANRFHLASELKDCIGLLRKVGATRIGIACNTLHSFLPQAVCEDLIHLPQRVMASLRRQGWLRRACSVLKQRSGPVFILTLRSSLFIPLERTSWWSIPFLTIY